MFTIVYKNVLFFRFLSINNYHESKVADSILMLSKASTFMHPLKMFSGNNVSCCDAEEARSL
jgi:hypothetical protein